MAYAAALVSVLLSFALGLSAFVQVASGEGESLHQLVYPWFSVGGLQAGLQRTKSIDFSYPQGANDFTGNRVTTGGQFWRVVQFMPSCKCWQVVQRDFKRGF